ncbi:MAG: carbohydrate ABC transporter permease, partial [Microbacterium sp.]|nr:carbohydrate ABC transporter permease [Microbacterium sp.]
MSAVTSTPRTSVTTPPSAAPRPRRHRTVRASRIVNYVLLAVVVLCYLFPLLFLLNTALKSNAAFFADPVGVVTSPQWGNFAQAWVQGNFGAYFLNSVVYTVFAAGLGTAIAVVMGFPVGRGYLRFPRLWNALFVVMLFLPNALITQFQLLLRIGLYNTYVGYILIMAAAVGIGPLLISGYVKSLQRELDEAAAVDGCGYWRYLLTFVIPMAKPAIATVFILQAIGVWNDIILATILLPDQAKSPISLGLYAVQGT